MYGTAWKKDRTEELVTQAVTLGFRGIDTACQPKHYYEPGVGAALAKLEQVCCSVLLCELLPLPNLSSCVSLCFSVLNFSAMGFRVCFSPCQTRAGVLQSITVCCVVEC